MTDVTVDLKDLKKLIGMCFEMDVNERALTSVMVTGSHQNREGALKFGNALRDATPEAEQMIELRYRDLQSALASGTGVREPLAKFVKPIRNKRRV